MSELDVHIVSERVKHNDVLSAIQANHAAELHQTKSQYQTEINNLKVRVYVCMFKFFLSRLPLIFSE